MDGQRERYRFAVRGPLGLVDLEQLASLERPSLRSTPFVPHVPAGMAPTEDLFAHIARGDVLLYHPFDAFSVVVDFITRAATDPQVLARDMLQSIPHPGLSAGEVRLAGFPVKLSASPASARRYPPRLGEHTDELLRELGYPSEEIKALIASGAAHRLPQ